MRRSHLDLLEPICPACRREDGAAVPIALACVERELGEHVIEGLLHCGAADRTHEYPILDGVPVLVAGLRDYVPNALLALTERRDLSPALHGLIGECCGPDSAFENNRLHLSSYGWDHWGDRDPEERHDPPPGSVVRVLRAGLERVGDLPEGPLLDLGAAVGRASFELAAAYPGRPVLGVELNFALVRLAAEVLRTGVVRYPRRRLGLVYDERRFEAAPLAPGGVDFWACDVQELPFPDGRFALAAGLHLVDSVGSPLAYLSEVARVLVRGGAAIVASPFDWATHGTPVAGWLGGQAPRSAHGGSSVEALRQLLAPGAGDLALAAEIPDVPWTMRLHERSTMHYRDHVVVARRA